MSALAFTHLFLFFLLSTLFTRFWLAARQWRSVSKHRDKVPEQFSGSITPDAHRKAADYTLAKIRFSLTALVVDTLVLTGFTLGGGLQYLASHIFPVAGNAMTGQIALIAATAIIAGAIDLPFDYYRQFVIEEKFGFNHMTRSLYLCDLAKQTAIGIAIGLPVLWILLTVMKKAGAWWWFYAWILWCLFQFLMLFLYPTLIAPLFNRFTPLADEALKTRIERLMQRTGFRSSGLFVMDGSKRSAHGNAYFTGMGSAKRVVFFDTLLARLTPDEIEAVLAHELGHFHLKHVFKRIVFSCLSSLALLALLGFLRHEAWFYAGLGIDPAMASDALALILFALTLPVFTFFLSPLISGNARKHEFEADAFSAKHTQACHLVNALVKLYEDNAATLTPDPLHSAFYDSHPPASIRIHHLLGHS